MKRFVTLMIVFAMLFAAVPAFADVTTSKAGEFPITSEKVTFDVWIEGGSDTDLVEQRLAQGDRGNHQHRY